MLLPLPFLLLSLLSSTHTLLSSSEQPLPMSCRQLHLQPLIRVVPTQQHLNFLYGLLNGRVLSCSTNIKQRERHCAQCTVAAIQRTHLIMCATRHSEVPRWVGCTHCSRELTTSWKPQRVVSLWSHITSFNLLLVSSAFARHLAPRFCIWLPLCVREEKGEGEKREREGHEKGSVLFQRKVPPLSMDVYLILRVVRLVLVATALSTTVVCSFSRDSFRHSDSSWQSSRERKEAIHTRAWARTLSERDGQHC